MHYFNVISSIANLLNSLPPKYDDKVKVSFSIGERSLIFRLDAPGQFDYSFTMNASSQTVQCNWQEFQRPDYGRFFLTVPAFNQLLNELLHRITELC